GHANNPTGRNQYSDWGVVEMIRERPFAAAAAAAGAAATRPFLWSKRAQISDQLSNLSGQGGQRSSNMRSGDGSDFETMGSATGATRSGAGSASASSKRSTARSTQTAGSPG